MYKYVSTWILRAQNDGQKKCSNHKSPANTKYLYNIYTMSDPTLYKCYTIILCSLGGWFNIVPEVLVLRMAFPDYNLFVWIIHIYILYGLRLWLILDNVIYSVDGILIVSNY